MQILGFVPQIEVSTAPRQVSCCFHKLRYLSLRENFAKVIYQSLFIYPGLHSSMKNKYVNVFVSPS